LPLSGLGIAGFSHSLAGTPRTTFGDLARDHLKIEVTCAQCGHRRIIDAASPRLRRTGRHEIFTQRQEGREERHAPAQEGHAEKRQGWQGRHGEESQAGDRHRLSEARKKGKKVPKRRTSGKKSSK
jgi:hypothetical protein